ncbi:MAG: peroxide stress protein YaaA [Actinocatenispora sp.]
MLVLLPPSESKAPGGRGAPLRTESLSFPSLNPVRARLMDSLRTLSSNVAVARKVLKLSEHQDAELANNLVIHESPTRPAIQRYTGVLYEGLDYASLSATARRRADRTLVVSSALFGAVRPRDPIPAYRLSGGATLPDLGPLRSVWRQSLVPVLADAELVLDLRSAAYQALAPVPDAVTVRVLSVRPDGSRTVVSHHNKSHKGRLARALCTAARPARSVNDVITAAREADLRLSVVDRRTLELLV